MKIIRSKKFEEMRDKITEQSIDLEARRLEIINLKSEIEAMKNNKDDLHKRYCEHCKFGLQTEDEITFHNPYVEIQAIREKRYLCALDVPCKNFSRR